MKKKQATKEKQSQRECLCWEIFWLVQNGGNPDGNSPIQPGLFEYLCCYLRLISINFAGDRTAVARYLCNRYTGLGVSIGMRAQIAAHKSLRTARRYVRLLPHERLQELAAMVNP